MYQVSQELNKLLNDQVEKRYMWWYLH